VRFRVQNEPGGAGLSSVASQGAGVVVVVATVVVVVTECCHTLMYFAYRSAGAYIV
jgi:hypothetical protein